nr:hypothetical protein TetV2_00352 [Oceanusvirus sp.]
MGHEQTRVDSMGAEGSKSAVAAAQVYPLGLTAEFDTMQEATEFMSRASLKVDASSGSEEPPFGRRYLVCDESQDGDIVRFTVRLRTEMTAEAALKRLRKEIGSSTLTYYTRDGRCRSFAPRTLATTFRKMRSDDEKGRTERDGSAPRDPLPAGSDTVAQSGPPASSPARDAGSGGPQTELGGGEEKPTGGGIGEARRSSLPEDRRETEENGPRSPQKTSRKV